MQMDFFWQDKHLSIWFLFSESTDALKWKGSYVWGLMINASVLSEKKATFTR